jgi:surface antigen
LQLEAALMTLERARNIQNGACLAIPSMLAAVAIWLASALPANAAAYFLSRNAPHLTAEDTRMIEQAIYGALGEGKTGAKAEWANSATGRAGQASVLQVSTKATMPCGSVEHIFTKGGGERFVLSYCRQPDGSWKIYD